MKENAFYLWCFVFGMMLGLLIFRNNSKTPEVINVQPIGWTTNGDGNAVVKTDKGDVRVMIVGTPQADEYPPTEFVFHNADSVEDLDKVVVIPSKVLSIDVVVAKVIEEVD